MTTITDLLPWLEHIRDRNVDGSQPARKWAESVANLVLSQDWKLFNHLTHIEDGQDLIFRKGDAMIELFIRGDFNLMGAKPGVRLSDQTESWEATFSVRTPLPVIKEAIDWLIPENE